MWATQGNDCHGYIIAKLSQTEIYKWEKTRKRSLDKYKTIKENTKTVILASEDNLYSVRASIAIVKNVLQTTNYLLDIGTQPNLIAGTFLLAL